MEQFLLFSTIFYYLFLDFHIKTGTRISLQDKRLFEISEVEITRVDCNCIEEMKTGAVSDSADSYRDLVTENLRERFV